MAHTVITRMPLLNRLHNTLDKTVNIAHLGRISVCEYAASALFPEISSLFINYF